jgi:hypothetical protein
MKQLQEALQGMFSPTRAHGAYINDKRTVARKLNAHHVRHCAGFYGSWGGRYFKAREHNGALQVSQDFGKSWMDVPEGGTFRDHNGRALVL